MPKKRRRAKPGHTSLKELKRRGSTLLSSMDGFPVHSSVWDRDLLPEHLWIASLRAIVPVQQIHQPFYAFMDAVDEFWSEPEPAVGLLSEFALLEKHKDSFLAKHSDLVDELFNSPFGRILAFYPDSPARWLVTDRFLERGGHLDPDVELSRLRSIVEDLMDRRGPLATAARCAVFGRFLKSGKVHFVKSMDIVELLPKYPTECTPDEREQVEAFVRASQLAMLEARGGASGARWPQSFWRQNANLVPCAPHLVSMHGSRPVSAEGLKDLESRITANTSAARKYLTQLARQIPYDIYAPEKGEILHGLFARCVRLYLLGCENPALWARDIAGVLLRCLVETTITFCYLAQVGTEEEFRKFRTYGDGQMKLLMLHLQDSHPSELSIEGRSSLDLSAELGGFSSELLQIELGHWSKKDIRKLAEEAGLSEFYRLVFSPASADVHGTWASLKHSNLCICAEPLHRFHRMPTFAEPPLYVSTLETAQRLILKAREVGEEQLGFPKSLHLERLLEEDHEPHSKE